MREHLLGYLMGALEPHEAAELEGSLAESDHLRRELDALRFCLQPLAADEGHLDPPDGLASRTCHYVVSCSATPTSPAWGPTAAFRGWRAADLLVAACVLVAGTLVFFPAMSYSRFQSHLAGCQNNLRQIGMGIAHYADSHNDLLPQLPTSGNEAAAGLHAVILREEGYVDGDSTFLCPGSPLLAAPGFRIPARAELRTATGERLESLKRALGGAYGYTLGYLDEGRYKPVRRRNRATFAIVADAPNLELATGQSANHRSRGRNVLFEDGHVTFLPTCQTCPFTKDDLYHNDDGEIAAGKHADDSVIGPSEIPPLGWGSN
jgi:hypothetical protein